MSANQKKALATMNTMIISRLEKVSPTRCTHMTPEDKACLLAIKGELPEPKAGGPFETTETYNAFWDTMELLESGDDKKLAKLLSCLMEKVDPLPSAEALSGAAAKA